MNKSALVWELELFSNELLHVPTSQLRAYELGRFSLIPYISLSSKRFFFSF